MTKYSIRDVLLMAERSEENAARFYRAAAEQQRIPAHRETLERMADMEDSHRALFSAMLEALPAEESNPLLNDPYGDAQLYLNAMVDRGGAEGSLDMAAGLTAHTPMAEIFRRAVESESKAVLFYMGLRDLMQTEEARAQVEHVIAEERKHIVMIQNLAREEQD